MSATSPYSAAGRKGRTILEEWSSTRKISRPLAVLLLQEAVTWLCGRVTGHLPAVFEGDSTQLVR
jgi:hypothetical protein